MLTGLNLVRGLMTQASETLCLISPSDEPVRLDESIDVGDVHLRHFEIDLTGIRREKNVQ